MKKIILLVFVLTALRGVSQTYTSVKVGPEEKIAVKIPSTLISMTDQDRMKQVYSSKVPLAMFANESQDVMLGINYNIMQWTENDTELIYGFYKASINNLFDDIEFIQDEVKEINGKKFIVFEFISSITSENVFSGSQSSKNYTYIQYTSYKEQVLLFNFNCKQRQMREWQPIATEVMNSIKIKE